MMWTFQMEGYHQCRFYLEPSFTNIEENFDSWVDNRKYYPDQILPSDIIHPATNHPQSIVDRLILSHISWNVLIYTFIKLVKGEERW